MLGFILAISRIFDSFIFAGLRSMFFSFYLITLSLKSRTHKLNSMEKFAIILLHFRDSMVCRLLS